MSGRMLTISPDLRPLLEACQVICVPECCGVDAYDVAAEHLANWITANNGIDQANRAILDLDVAIALYRGCGDEVLSAGEDFNAVWSADQCAEYLLVWRSQLAIALSQILNAKPAEGCC